MWQEKIDGAFLQYLTSRSTQFGLIRPDIATQLIARISQFYARFGLLNVLGQRLRSTNMSHQRDQLPLVYAMPATELHLSTFNTYSYEENAPQQPLLVQVAVRIDHRGEAPQMPLDDNRHLPAVKASPAPSNLTVPRVSSTPSPATSISPYAVDSRNSDRPVNGPANEQRSAPDAPKSAMPHYVVIASERDRRFTGNLGENGLSSSFPVVKPRSSQPTTMSNADSPVSPIVQGTKPLPAVPIPMVMEPLNFADRQIQQRQPGAERDLRTPLSAIEPLPVVTPSRRAASTQTTRELPLVAPADAATPSAKEVITRTMLPDTQKSVPRSVTAFPPNTSRSVLQRREGQSSGVDLDVLAEQVQRRISKRIEIELERRGRK